MTRLLSERRKADRRTMGDEIQRLALSYGATVKRELEGSNSVAPRRDSVYIEARGGLAVHVDFNGNSWQPDTHVLSWHLATGTPHDVELSGKLRGSGAGLNPRKATGVAYGFDALCIAVELALEAAADGSAYQVARKVAA